METLILEHFKKILQTMLADLELPLRRRDQIAIENTPDALDEVQNAAERDLAIRQLEHDSSRFRCLKAALQRIEEGTFGQCAHCESDISIKRLKAVPWAPYCLDCQDIEDQNTVEAELDILQLTDRGPKIMRAGQSAARGQDGPPLPQEHRSEDSDNGFVRNDLGPSSPAYTASREKKTPAAERLQRGTKQSA